MLPIVGWGYANKFYGLEKMLVGGGVMPKYFMDLKKMLGGGGLCPNNLWT